MSDGCSCIHERDWVRLEQVVERHDREIRELNTDRAETKIYMKQVLEAQEDIKDSIRGIQNELKGRPTGSTSPGEDWGATFRKMAPDIIKLAIILAIIIAGLVGAGSIVSTLMGGTQ